MSETFESDGCPGFMSILWKKIFGELPPWEGCCYEHDKKYWEGGTRRDRLKADKQLRKCVVDNGHPIWAFIMYYAVRIGGHPLFPFSWRWNYKHKYSKSYFYKDK